MFLILGMPLSEGLHGVPICWHWGKTMTIHLNEFLIGNYIKYDIMRHI